MRWEFGFTCPYCLLHEADRSPDGSFLTGQWTTDHIDPTGDRADYANCVYACRWCNSSRKRASTLNPRAAAISEHLAVDRDELVGLTVLGTATIRACNANNEAKKALRQARFEKVTKARERIAIAKAFLESGSRDSEARAIAQTLLEQNLDALRSLSIRPDTRACNCPVQQRLPDWLIAPSVEIPG